ncbi:hypothetical protein FHG87_001117 [Trinorchestia longiramus]|nr:hypothetical protein FHG87_001117 [Trinorchestia longiramus]
MEYPSVGYKQVNLPGRCSGGAGIAPVCAASSGGNLQTPVSMLRWWSVVCKPYLSCVIYCSFLCVVSKATIFRPSLNENLQPRAASCQLSCKYRVEALNVRHATDTQQTRLTYSSLPLDSHEVVIQSAPRLQPEPSELVGQTANCFFIFLCHKGGGGESKINQVNITASSSSSAASSQQHHSIIIVISSSFIIATAASSQQHHSIIIISSSSFITATSQHHHRHQQQLHHSNSSFITVTSQHHHHHHQQLHHSNSSFITATSQHHQQQHQHQQQVVRALQYLPPFTTP